MTEQEEYQQYLKEVGAAPAQPSPAEPSDEDLYKQYLAEVGAAPAEAPKGNIAAQAGANLAQGWTANLSDEIAGFGEAAGRVIGLEGVGTSDRSKAVNLPGIAPGGPTLDWETLRDAYRAARDKERGALKQDMKERPALAAGTQLAGALVSPVNKIAKGASTLKQGAAIGGMYSFGGSDDSGAGLAVDTALGAGLGAGVGYAADKVPGLLKSAAGSTKKSAQRWAARAMGAERGSINKLTKQGKNPEKVLEIGQYGLDNKMLGLRDSADDMILKNEAVKKAAMDARAAAYGKIDDAGASQFNPAQAADDAAEKVLAGKNFDHDDAKETFSIVDPYLQNIFSRGKENISMKEAQKLVEKLAEKSNFDTTRSKEANKIAMSVYHSVRKSINEAAEKGAEKIGVEGLKKTIEGANKQYATGMGAGVFLKNKSNRELGNKILGITNVGMAGAGTTYGAITGDWEKAALAMVGTKAAQKYGSKVMARGLNRVANALAKTPKMAAAIQKNPAVVQAIALGISGKTTPMSKAADKNNGADGGEFVADIKGHNKWSVDGYAKLYEHSADAISPEQTEKLFASPKGKQLLVQASDLKPGTKAMDKILQQIKKDFSNEKN